MLRNNWRKSLADVCINLNHAQKRLVENVNRVLKKWGRCRLAKRRIIRMQLVEATVDMPQHARDSIEEVIRSADEFEGIDSAARNHLGNESHGEHGRLARLLRVNDREDSASDARCLEKRGIVGLEINYVEEKPKRNLGRDGRSFCKQPLALRKERRAQQLSHASFHFGHRRVHHTLAEVQSSELPCKSQRVERSVLRRAAPPARERWKK